MPESSLTVASTSTAGDGDTTTVGGRPEEGELLARLEGRIQPYAWGSRTAIAALQGRAHPTPQPEAELWFGAHDAAPSSLATPDGAEPLSGLIARAPYRYLGTRTATRFGGRLPFLLKVLAAARPLSLQVHPDLPQAVHGCAAEDRAGIPRQAPDRCFRDAWPKPELLRAVTPFAALCGFRDPRETRELLRVLDLPGTAWLTTALETGRASALPGITERLLRLPPTERLQLLEPLLRAPDPDTEPDGRWTRTRHWLAELAKAYPDDPGVLVALLLELVELEPGEALSVPPGTPHAYLEGVGVEIMAASDNVLRGGMTSKHVDIERFVGLLHPTGRGGPPRVGRVTRMLLEEGHHRHLSATPYFQLDEYTPAATAHVLDRSGPAIVLCLEGQLTLSSGAQQLQMGRGQAAFIAGADHHVGLHCSGTAVVATPGADRSP